jgi:hypothetical protein
MALGRIALLLLALGLAACGAVADRPPRPSPPPEVRLHENQGPLKAATWRAQAAAAAERARLLAIAIGKARRSTTVSGALRLALLTGRISPATHARLAREYADARAAAGRLTGARAAELWSVIGEVDALAADHMLETSRLPATFLILRRNTRFWTHEPFPAASQRTTFGDDPAVFQYYPGHGMQLQSLASWGKANWLAGACLRSRGNARRRSACPVNDLRHTIDRLLALAAHRGDFLGFEYYFTWGGGTPPWISGMTQGTAVSALARAARALDEPRWRRAADRALGAFSTPPPLGVDGGDHFLMYSFAPTMRVFNGELQAVSGIGTLSALYPLDREAGRLFRRGERTARAMVGASDTGAWSLYSLAGDESTLGYHQLVETFLGDMCKQTLRRIYCAARDRFARYEREPTRIAIAPLRKLRARRATTVRFSLSKVSSVTAQVLGKHAATLTRDVELPHGLHTLVWTPPSRGRYRVRIAAQGPSGPLGVSTLKVDVRLPKPKPKKKPCKRLRKSEKRCSAEKLTPRRETGKVSG